MSQPTVSVIVVSRGRPEALQRCLMGLEQLAYPDFEVVVVADPAGIAAIADWKDSLKWAEYDVANISAARNIGAGLAGGEILAFIDDDAVPEPSWLSHLIAPFADATVSIAGGYVLGRDGVNYQYRANRVDRLGRHDALELVGDSPRVFDAPKEGAIKTEGTNFAIRRQVLADIGGFDEAFRYYMDETDLNFRLARAGARTAIVPLALVHHGFAASERRSRQGRSITLFDIGASLVVFLRKHVPPEDHAAAVDGMRANHRRFQEKHSKAGKCTPAQAKRALETLEEGFKAGKTMEYGRPVDLGPPPAMQRFDRAGRFSGSVAIGGRFWQGRRLKEAAARRVAAGERVTLILLEPTPRRMRVSFTPQGYWLHSGGQFGRASSEDARLTLTTGRARTRQEIARIREVRGLTEA